MSSQKAITVKVEGHEIQLSHLDKVLYPSGFTKKDVLHYYSEIAPFMLPHLKGRLLTMKRYPEGTMKEYFYEKRCPPYRPKWLHTAALPSKRNPPAVHYCVVDNLASLLWVANLASLEFHILLSKVPNVTQPTLVVFDIDPGPGMKLWNCAQMALKIRELLKGLKLECLAKTSGGKGMHLYIPLNQSHTFDETKNFARSLALLLEKEEPKKVTSNMKKEFRKGKLFLDWSQNTEHKTTVAVYSLRAQKNPTVSTPLDWEEVAKLAKSKNEKAFQFTADQVLKRVKKRGDLFKPVLTLKQKLPKFEKLEKQKVPGPLKG